MALFIGILIFVIYSVFAGAIFKNTIDYINDDVPDFDPLLILFALLSGPLGWFTFVMVVTDYILNYLDKLCMFIADSINGGKD